MRTKRVGCIVIDLKACYRKLRPYKYQLMRELTMVITIAPDTDIETSYLKLTREGVLTVKVGYAWDGPSGPTIDTLTFMRASLVHDVLYQLMRLQHLDYRLYRKYADDLLREMCLADGMNPVRAWYVHRALRWFGAPNARPQVFASPVIICAPR